ncbi:MAG: hypothetical protein JNJ54_18380 [Myxococcaceae bacterium]|nr:hypothetical protein [Myxococcaceae bacterium]
MKIRSPTSQPKSIVDVAKVPSPTSPTGSISAPVPNLPSSTFSPANGVERRFSVRFLQGIEARLQRAGANADLVKDLLHRFKHMDRTGLDREGRIVDRLLESGSPKEHLALYGLLAQRGSLVAPNGASVAANDQGSWTIRPPGGEPFELLAKPGLTADLGGGFSAVVKDEGTLEAAGQQLQLESSARAQERATEFALALGPASQALATTFNPAPLLSVTAWYGAQTMADQLGAYATYFDRCGLPEAASVCRGGARGSQVAADIFAAGTATNPTGRPLVSSAVSLMTLDAMPRAAHDQVMRLLEKAGRSAAPSSRSDPLLEKAAILRQLAKDPMPFLENDVQRQQQALNALSSLAAKLRGAARDTIVNLA